MSDMESTEREVQDYLRANSGSSSYRKRFSLSSSQYVQIGVTHVAGAAIQADVPIGSELIDFSINFRSGSDNWYRIDNQGEAGFLHCHLHSGSQRSFCDHIPLEGEFSISGLVSICFKQANAVKEWKYPMS
jgi:hypothetical protein